MFRNIVWDVDGTLFDTYPAIARAFKTALNDFGKDDGYPKKPHPAAFEAILKTHELPREETLTVGDRDIDILAGRASGLFTCLFGNETEGVTADLTIRSFEELYRYLQAIS
jgi:phosphoglycolate phosphatase-like HAD superfamily hydrolase